MRLAALRDRTRLLLALGLPVLGLAAYSADVVVRLDSASTRIETLDGVGALAVSVADVVREVQKERAIAAAGGADAQALRRQRDATDAATSRLERDGPDRLGLDSEAFAAALQAARADLHGLSAVRGRIDRGEWNSGEAAAVYAGLIAGLQTVVETAVVAADPLRAAATPVGWADLLYPGSADGPFGPPAREQLTELASAQQADLAMLSRGLEPESGRIRHVAAVEDRIGDELAAAVDHMRDDARGRYLLGVAVAVGLVGTTLVLAVLLVHGLVRRGLPPVVRPGGCPAQA